MLQIIRRLPDEVVVQVVERREPMGFVHDFIAQCCFEGFERPLTAIVVVKERMNNVVGCKFLHCLVKTVDGVQHDIVARVGNQDAGTLFVVEHQVGKEVHEALEEDDMLLHLVVALSDDRDVLVADTTFIIRVSDLIAANPVAEGYAEEMLVAEVVMHLAAIDTANMDVYLTLHQIGE